MGFGIDRRARSKKPKGLFRRAPAWEDVGQRLGLLLLRMKRASSRQLKQDDRFLAEVTFHPKAPPVRLTVMGPDAELHVKGQTSTLGPGYHADVLAKLEPVLDELEYAWTEPAPEEPAAAMCKWLASELGGDDQVWIGLTDRFMFMTNASVLTPVGPRDAAWRAAVLADPMKGADAFPWWTTGAGTRARADALLAMWQDVPWRETLDDLEIEMMEKVDRDLATAKAAGLTELPYPDWAELLGYLGRDDKAASEVYKLAGDRPATIGYRRLDHEVALSGGWTVTLPGSFAGRWEEDHSRYVATDGARAIEFTSLTADGETDSATLLEVAAPAHPVLDRFTDGTRCGRAEVSDEDYTHIVHGLVTQAPHVAILTLKGAKTDEAWALETWRSLRRE
ncbi:hypothetical protein BH11MYX1_BH11MYX1_43500 [soil metagenome]